MTGLQTKLFRYFLTAGTAAVVDVGGFAILCFFPIPIAVSATTSFCISTVVNFFLTSRCVFNQRPTIRGYGVFFLAAVVGMMVNVSVTLVGSLCLGIAPLIAKILGVGTAFLINFWLNLRIVFRTPSLGRNQ
jgi:putative flippase GtrA